MVLIAAGLPAAGGLLSLWLFLQVHEPFPPHSAARSVTVQIPAGYSVRDIGGKLEGAGIVRSAQLFRWYVRLLSGSHSLQAGEYEFRLPIALPQVVEKIERGAVLYHRVTIPEGLDMMEIVEVLSRQGLGVKARFEAAVQDPSPISDLDPDARNLEGFLFPDTYLVTRSMSEQQIVAVMVQKFRSLWTARRRQDARRLGMNVHQVVTLASLIEKETHLASERPLVSAVFHNRLKEHLKLACDPTVIYAVRQVEAFDGVINRSDLRIDSPYNTYLYPGLPPGPIASPGVGSIDAALHPADADYLFFVAKNDGSHYFSSNYRDHRRAVAKYQR